jgi:hypothetical protein
MMFLLTESILNGTVTMSVHGVAVDAPDFASAKAKLKAMPNMVNAAIHTDSDEVFSFSIPQQDVFGCFGHMENKPLKVI